MTELQYHFVKKPINGRRLLISDIHGCFKTFKKLLKKIKLQKQDQLFLLGDFVNKGPASNKVLDLILKLQRKKFTIYLIRGNHEQIVLNTIFKSVGQRKRMLKNVNALNLLDGKQIKNTYIKLLESSFHFIELDCAYLVHAGFNSKKNTFSDKKAMISAKKFDYDAHLFQNKQVFIGHSPTPFSKIKSNVKNRSKIVCIDNGCVNEGEPDEGRLACINIDTSEIHRKKYAEF